MSSLDHPDGHIPPLLAGAASDELVCSEAWSRVLAACLDSESGRDGLAAYRPLLEKLARPRLIDLDASRLVDEAADAWARPGFETFISLPHLRFEPFPHQLQAASTALRRMRGRAILADEVGLGKTIEAGLVLSELRLRRLAGRVLILVPAGLVQQWWEELDRKFGLPCVAQGSETWRRMPDPLQAPIVILSLASARRAPLKDRLAAASWDLVLVDEAHRLKQPRSASAKLVRSLLSRYLLLLTATPVENRLDDLFQLVSLVRPGHLGTLSEFRTAHGPGGEEAVRDTGRLQARTREVMIRHRRSEVALMLPRRLAETFRVSPGVKEAALYQAVSDRVREQARGASPTELLALRSLQRLAGSSPQALVPGLERRGWADLAEQARAVGPAAAKTEVLMQLLGRHLERAEKVIIFAAFRQTLDLLIQTVKGAVADAAVYHGGLSRREKEEAVRRFREESPVLLTTEAAGEGRNLQFAHVMINYDLPWNPMQIEQRLGRIHRIGQDHDVTVANLATMGTIEEQMLRVLERKINLFELVVGELDMILGRIEEDFDFESFLFRLHVDSDDQSEFGFRLDAFGDELARARRDYLEGRARNDAVVGEARDG